MHFQSLLNVQTVYFLQIEYRYQNITKMTLFCELVVQHYYQGETKILLGNQVIS
jgi:hypothetical protein